jgi:OTU domain-containing protein 6
MCADTLASHTDDFAPFCEYTDDNDKDDNPYQAYVAKVRHSAEWGGHLELRALALALNRPILVYQAHSAVPLEITSSSPSPSSSSSDDWIEPIRLSYHRHYYALGEHYNQVVVAAKDTENASEE